MKPRLVIISLVVALVACTGLLTEPGNDFPCDFSKPPGTRDSVCSAGDVCGVDNRCRRFRYEGPQFEGPPTFPDFSDGGVRLHPMTITGRIDFIARVHQPEPEPDGTPMESIVVHTSAPEGTYRIDSRSDDGGAGLVGSITLAKKPTALTDVVLFDGRLRPRGKELRIMGREPSQDVYLQDAPRNRIGDGPGDLKAFRVRAFAAESNRSQFAAITTTSRAGSINFNLSGDATFTEVSPMTAIDVAPGPPIPGRSRALVVIGTDGFRVPNRNDAGVVVSLPTASFPPLSTIAADVTGSTYAVLSVGVNRVSLSTWSVTKTTAGFEVQPAWSDCTPCGREALRRDGGVAIPLAFSTGSDLSGPFVDVLCAQDGLKRVRNASTASGGPCLDDDQPLPFDFAALETESRTGMGIEFKLAEQDFSDPTSFRAGGKSGQVWVGKTIGSAVPLFLDRVPTDISQVDLDGREGMFALTAVGAFFRSSDPDKARSTNGFRVVDPDSTSRIAGFVHETDGWVITRTGDLALGSVPANGSFESRFGPRLIDGRGEPASRVLFGEGISTEDGGLVSMVVAADDSLYFVPAPPMPSNAPGMLGEVAPVLTPEPSTLIRSLALERTPIGTNGVDRVRGYVVTSRNVYEFKLGGAPLRWTATPLRLAGDEPVEVWFDNPRGGLARVGYRDGTIFSIPGGFQIAEALPGSDAGVPSAVIDYENLGGWPVALTTTGLFVARYDALDSGRLDSRFPDGGVNKPMTWREVRQMRDVRGRLHVVADPQIGTDFAYRRLFHLLLFLPNEVLEVGQHLRTNISRLGGGAPVRDAGQ